MARRWMTVPFLGIGVLLTSLSCIPTDAEVHATKDPRFTGQMRSIYVIIAQQGIDEDFAVELGNLLRQELARRGIASRWRFVGSREVDAGVVDREVAMMQPDGILTILPVRGLSVNGTITHLTYELVLLETERGQRIWRASVTNQRDVNFGTIRGMGEEAAARIAERLTADGLLATRTKTP